MKSNHTLLNDAQLQMLDLMSVLNTEDEFDGLRKVITEYLGNRLKNEIDKLWADGSLTEDKVEGFRSLHERTPYRNKVSIAFP